MNTCYEIDVFTGPNAKGNPAGVCILPDFPPDETMQCLAEKNGYSQTAFVVRRNSTIFDLRWFTPHLEDNLCGHATLAAAFALFCEGQHLWPICFRTRSGPLVAIRDGERWELGLPNWPAQAVQPPRDLLAALGVGEADVLRTRDYLIVVESEEIVQSITPDLGALAALVPGLGGVIVTAASRRQDVDYIVRFFAPSVGIDEDPATGSAACTHAPYWAKRLGKDVLAVRQLSRRGGFMKCRIDGTLVKVAGFAQLAGVKHVG